MFLGRSFYIYILQFYVLVNLFSICYLRPWTLPFRGASARRRREARRRAAAQGAARATAAACALGRGSPYMSSVEAMPRRCSSFCYSSSSPGSKFLPCCCYCWPHGFADGYSSNSGATQGRMPGSPLPPLQMCWTPPPPQLRPQPTGYSFCAVHQWLKCC